VVGIGWFSRCYEKDLEVQLLIIGFNQKMVSVTSVRVFMGLDAIWLTEGFSHEFMSHISYPTQTTKQESASYVHRAWLFSRNVPS